MRTRLNRGRGLAVLLGLFLVASCSRTESQSPSPYYEIKTVISDGLGHTAVHTHLLGYPKGDRSQKPVLLAPTMLSYRLWNPDEGRKIIFVGRFKDESDRFSHVFVSDDGEHAREVTEAVIQLGKKSGKIPPTAEYPRDYRFAETEYVDSKLVVHVYVYRIDAGFPMGTETTVEVNWDALNR